jgi:site-specific DNA-methyltransferase (adenine-specific)
MLNLPLPRIDKDEELQEMLKPYCRLSRNDIWNDPQGRHKVGCIDASSPDEINSLLNNEKAQLAVHDPPYNFIAFGEVECAEFIKWSREWIKISYDVLDENSSLYLWLGADQQNYFQPFGEFMVMMKDSGFNSRSFITMRNQRGYGTQKNWMSIRQELLYYTKGKPEFNIEAEYTDIPKVLRGYYKVVAGRETENMERSKSGNIRAGNVWIDIQQVFYRMEENVNGCYAQKPLKALERIISSGTNSNELVIDFFSHSGTTLIASEKLNRRCFTTDIDPLYCEITIRRLERYRSTGKTGWQNSNPFYEEITNNRKLKSYLVEKYKYPETNDYQLLDKTL